MSWLEDKYEEITGNPEKAAKLFKVTWIVAYSMLIIGAITIVVCLANQYL